MPMLKVPPTETDTSQMSLFSEYLSYLRGAGKGNLDRMHVSLWVAELWAL